MVTAVLETLNPYFYKLLIDNLSSRDYWLLVKIIILFVGVKILANLSHAMNYWLGDKILIPAARDVRLAVFRRIQELDFAYHVNKNTGSLISAFKRGDGAFFDIFHSINHELARLLISLLVALYFFVRVTPSIAFILLGFFIANIFISWRLIKHNMRIRREFNRSEDAVSGIITDNLLNYETVKFFAQEKKEEARLQKQFEDWFEKLWAFANSFRLMDVMVGSLANIGMLVILWVTLKKMVSQEISSGDFILVASFMTGFYYRFFDLLYRMRHVARHYVDIKKYLEILEQPILVKDPEKPVDLLKVKGEIEFQDVDFAYPDSKRKMILKDINLKIKPGESVAFVGRSGAGKTTLVKILLRFYDLNQGRILLDGVDIADFAKSRLRLFIGVVPQEPVLFNNTVGFNISYGNDQVSQAEIVKAAKTANLDRFIDGLPKKYETEVGERGIKLSGGQKQRLAIARMILADPQIIVFDEATSNLDSESERLIQEALWKIARGRTVLIIAHRFSTVRKADRIIVMNHGRIAEEGSHQNLIKRQKGLYQYLWQLQTKGELDE